METVRPEYARVACWHIRKRWENAIPGNTAQKEANPALTQPKPNRQITPPKIAALLTAAVLTGFAVIGLVNLMRWTSAPLGGVWSIFLMSGSLVLQVFHCVPDARHLRDRYSHPTLGLQAAMTLAVFPLTHVPSGTMAGFLAGSVLIVLRNRVAIWCLLGLIGLQTLVEATLTHSSPPLFYLMASTLAIALITYGLRLMCDLMLTQYRARDRAARMAVSSERLRFARDLHDLLGYSLSAITLKNELVYRLIGTDDARAREEVAETLKITRQALKDLRAVVSGYRSVSLTQELDTLKGVLVTAGVEVTVEGVPDRLAARADLLAAVLREAVTNVLRHSRASRCRIKFAERQGRFHLTVSNNGLNHRSGKAVDNQRRGTGLDNLTTRMSALHGHVATSVEGEWFHLHAECPATLAPANAGPGRVAEIAHRDQGPPGLRR